MEGNNFVELTPVVKEGYHLALDEIKNVFSEQGKTLETTKSTAQQVLAAASLIVALVGVFPLTGPNGLAERSLPSLLLLGLTAACYILLITLCTYVIDLSIWTMPVSTDWETYREAFIDHESDEALYQKVISSYLNAIAENRPLVQRKAKAIKIAAWMLPAIVISLALAIAL